ncbi:MAG: hypothetical protein CR977_03920, partial [Gammaproteobacteria bacterium]
MPSQGLSSGHLFDFTVVVNDGKGGQATQNVTLVVQAATPTNTPPTITSSPSGSATVNTAWQYDVDATDADGDTLTYALQNAPAGMTINAQSGLIEWTPVAAGSISFTVTVDDGKGGTAQQAITITVQSVGSNLPLTLELYIIPDSVNVGEDLTITVTPREVSGNLVHRKLWVDGVEVALDNLGQATITATDIGTHTVRAEAKDDDETATQTGTFLVKDPSDTTPPVVKIDSPVSDTDITTISDLTDVLITV